MKRPAFLKKGDTIGITAPSFGCTTEPYKSRLKKSIRIFEERGYKVKVGKTVFMADGKGISTDPAKAAEELTAFYTDPEVKAIISAGGGECMCETISHLDFDLIKKSPAKWFSGYSDNTNFIHPLVTIAGVAAIYGPCISGFGKRWEEPEEDCLALLEGKCLSVKGYKKFQSPEDEDENSEIYILNKKKILKNFIPSEKKLIKADKNTSLSFEGTLLGGCLDVLENLAGTRFDKTLSFIKKQDKIVWVLEACDGLPTDIRRWTWHLKECGWFQNAAGFIIGRPLNAFGKKMMGIDQYNAVTDILKELEVPVIMDADMGHIDPAMPLIIGSKTKVKAKGNDLSLDFSF